MFNSQAPAASIFKQGAIAILVFIAFLIANWTWQAFFITQASSMFAAYSGLPQSFFVCILILLLLSSMSSSPTAKWAPYLPLQARHYPAYQATLVFALVVHLSLNSPFPDALTTYSYIALFVTRPLLAGYYWLTTKKAK